MQQLPRDAGGLRSPESSRVKLGDYGLLPRDLFSTLRNTAFDQCKMAHKHRAVHQSPNEIELVDCPSIREVAKIALLWPYLMQQARSCGRCLCYGVRTSDIMFYRVSAL